MSALFGQWPLKDRVLVVYNAGDPDSVSVASHYISRRGIPSATLCPVTPGSVIVLDRGSYETAIRDRVRACVDLLGRSKILYIVMTYNTPFRLMANGRPFSLDSALSDLYDEGGSYWDALPSPPHAYAAHAQSQGNYYPSFQSFADYRAGAGSKAIYPVFRLDGPTAAISKGLVDKALAAESAGLSGNACIDRRSGLIGYQPDSGNGAGEWNLSRAADFLEMGGFSVLEDAYFAEIGTSPAPLRCDSAAFYAGWYSYNNYNDVYTWNAGAMSFHMDSGSALDPRGGTNWTSNSLSRGVTMTSGAVSEPYLEGLTNVDGFFRDILSGANAADAAFRNTLHTKWMISHFGDPLYRPFPGGKAPFPLPAEDWLRLDPPEIVGGLSGSARINLAVPAPAGGLTIPLESRTPAVATVPASVFVSAGSNSATFAVSTTPTVDANRAVLVATLPGNKKLDNTITTLPWLRAVTISDTSAIGGTPLTGEVSLYGPAPVGGITVALSSSSAAIPVPASVTVPAGASKVDFPMPTSAVAADSAVTVTGAYAGTSRAATVTLYAPTAASLTLAPTRVTGGSSSTGTVTLTGPAPAGGIAIALTKSGSAVTVPSSATAAAGSTSVNFPIATLGVGATTTVSITATLGVARTANLTIDPGVQSLTATTPVMGGAKLSLTVTIADSAPAGGTAVALASNHPAAPVPPSVTVLGGTKSATVTINTTAVTAAVNVTFTATVGTTSRTATSRLEPAILSSLTGLSSVKSGNPVTMTVTLNAPAPPGGATIALWSSQPVMASVPATMIVPAGATSANFTVTTYRVSSQATATIRASCAANSKERTLTLRP